MGEAFAHAQASRWIGIVEGGGELAVDHSAELVIKVSDYVAPLMKNAPLHKSSVAEDLSHPCSKGLGPVDHTEDPVLEAQSTLHQVCQESGHDHGVLCVAFVESDRDLRAVGGDNQGDYAAPAAKDDAVDHDHGDIYLRQVPGEQLCELYLGRLHEPATHRGLRLRLGSGLQSLPDRLSDEHMTSGGHAGKHPFDDE